MLSSSSQYCSRSLPETSARLPAETNVESPRPRRETFSRIAMPSAPDWQKNPARPRGRHHRRQRGVEREVRRGVDDAERVGTDQPQPVGRGRAGGLALQLPALLAGLGEPRRRRRSSPCTPLCAQSSTTSGTASAGTATIATSTAPGDVGDAVVGGHPLDRLGRRGSRRRPGPGSRRARGCGPADGRPCRAGGWRRSPRRCAPRRTAATDAVSARCSRACMTSSDVVVGSIENSRCMTPSSNPPATW